jgi:catechol 2,3-dioxygenase-like lactoylglutathione lyase family enzyme
MNLHHIGIAVNSIEETAKWYIAMGYTLSETIEDPIQNVRVAFLEKSGGGGGGGGFGNLKTINKKKNIF